MVEDRHVIETLGKVKVVIENGEMDLGEFGFIHFIDFDNTRARQRTVQVMVMGE
mgnify:CR=1 FL=1